MTLRAVTLEGARPCVRRRTADFLLLAKPRVVLMVLVTTAVGFHLGTLGRPDPLLLLHVLFGTGFAAAGALALNQFLERDLDGRMRRTERRPLPDRRLEPRDALWFGLPLVLLGPAYLALTVNALSAGVTALTAASYLLAYTPLKRRTPLCTLLGAIPGALPPVTGWVAARGTLGVEAWILFGILFLWQVPHTLAIACVHRGDYARADLRMLPVVDPEGRATSRQVLLGCVALFAVGLLPALVRMAGPLYCIGAMVLGAGMLAVGIDMAISQSCASARRLLYASLVYLPVLFVLMAVDKLRL